MIFGNMKKLNFNHLLAFFSLCVLPASLSAQIYVDADNEVGIGTLTPTAKLYVYQAGNTNGNNTILFNAYAGTGAKYGLTTYITNDGSGARYGVYNSIYSPTNLAYNATGVYNLLAGTVNMAHGVYNDIYQASTAVGTARGTVNDVSAEGNTSAMGEYTYIGSGSGSTGIRYGNYIYVSSSGSGTKYGVYSSALGSGNYAGYFTGNVYVSGTFTNPSDARTKENIRQIDGALGIVTRLQPRSYEYRQDLGLGLPEGQQFGFVAQDLERVLPQLVKDAQAPVMSQAADATAARAADGSPKEAIEPTFTTIKSVNYIGLIPILTQAVQELSAKVDAQASTIARLESELQQR